MISDSVIEDFLKFYNYKVPDPENCPREFAYYVKLFRYCTRR